MSREINTEATLQNLSTPAPDPVGVAEIELAITNYGTMKHNAAMTGHKLYTEHADAYFRDAIDLIERLAQGGQSWQPISTAPFTLDEGAGNQWLNECLLLLTNGVAIQGMCSGGMWLRRDEESPDAWCDLLRTPTHWQPLPTPPTTTERAGT